MRELIDRLRNGPYSVGLATGEIRELSEAADALESQQAHIAELEGALEEARAESGLLSAKNLELMDQLNEQDAAISGLTESLEPFAREADRWTAHTPDSTPMTAEPITQEGWEYRFALGDLRQARAVLRKGEGERE